MQNHRGRGATPPGQWLLRPASRTENRLVAWLHSLGFGGFGGPISKTTTKKAAKTPQINERNRLPLSALRCYRDRLSTAILAPFLAVEEITRRDSAARMRAARNTLQRQINR